MSASAASMLCLASPLLRRVALCQSEQTTAFTKSRPDRRAHTKTQHMDLRLDRLATLYLVAPFLRSAGGSEQSIPILMYHSITDEDESSAHAYYRTKTSPAAFAAQMKHLHESGYKTCSPAQALSQLQTQTAARLVVITFDDGYRDFYHHAFPILNQYGYSAIGFSAHCLHRRASAPVQRHGLFDLGRSPGTEQARNPVRIPHRHPPLASRIEPCGHR